jgi:hypothetical protein
MIARFSRVPVALLFVVAFALSGCGGEEHVGNTASGTVTFQGKPLEQGTIEFAPAAGQGTFSGGAITNGTYSLPPTAGLEPGQYTVRISSVEGGESAPTDQPPGEPIPTGKQIIPAQYNAKSTLTAEIKDGGENKFDFDLK